MAMKSMSTIVAVKNQSPLVVGFDSESGVVASDEVALSSKYQECIHLEDMEIVSMTISGRVCVKSTMSSFESRRESRGNLAPASSVESMGAFPDFMSKEMSEIPRSITYASDLRLRIKPLVLSRCRVLLTGCGSAYHAARIGHSIRTLLDPSTDTTAYPADELDNINIDVFDAIVFISQSGETSTFSRK